MDLVMNGWELALCILAGCLGFASIIWAFAKLVND
jgi:hypothetical protein